MSQTSQAHVPSEILAAIQDTADATALDREVVLTAAVAVFCRQSAATRRSLVEDFWYESHLKLAMLRALGGNKTLKEKLRDLAANLSAPLRRFLARGRPRRT